MQPDLDIESGEFFVFPQESMSVLFRFVSFKQRGMLVFVNETTEGLRKIPSADFVKMRTDGRAVRVRNGKAPLGDIDPCCFLSDEDPDISASERVHRRRAAQKMEEARTLRYYAMAYDEAGHVSLSTRALDHFRRDCSDEASAHGFSWVPSASAVRRALNKHGTKGDRPLEAFLERGRQDAGTRWPEVTLRLKAEMIAAYWAPEKIRPIDAISMFYTKFDEEKFRRESQGEKFLARPTKQTLRNWINSAENFLNYERRYDTRQANRRFRGRGKCIKAGCVLEYVMFDHTQVDAWALVKDTDENIISEMRPWLTLAIDVYSRAILGAVLTIEPPSVYSVLLCLRQVVRPKQFLLDEFGEHKGATDCWGKPGTIIVDNGWEFAGVSFQVCCEAAGINVIWAPVRTPEFKAYVERAFGTFNAHLWHRLPGAVPDKPHKMAELRLKPQSQAKFTLEEFEDRLWRCIVTIYHVEVHSGIGKAPARAWAIGRQRTGRPMIDDVASLDKLLGTARRCTLRADGVRVSDQRFHDRVATTQLLDDLLRYGPKNKRMPNNQSGKVAVLVTVDPATCEYVHVWNPRRKKNVRLPNVHPRFSEGCSWRVAEMSKDYADRENLEFHSDEDKYAARSRFLETLVPTVQKAEFKERKRRARLLTPMKPGIVRGDHVVVATAEPSVSGMSPVGVPNAMAALERDDNRIPAKGPKRGGKNATRKRVKPAALRKSKQSELETRRALQATRRRLNQPMPSQSSKSQSQSSPAPASYVVHDATSLLDALETDLD